MTHDAPTLTVEVNTDPRLADPLYEYCWRNIWRVRVPMADGPAVVLLLERLGGTPYLSYEGWHDATEPSRRGGYNAKYTHRAYLKTVANLALHNAKPERLVDLLQKMRYCPPPYRDLLEAVQLILATWELVKP